MDKELTLREIEIIKLIKDGLTTNQIAEMLYISYTTAKKHVENIKYKLGAFNKVHILTKFNELYSPDYEMELIEKEMARLVRHIKKAKSEIYKKTQRYEELKKIIEE